MAPLLVQRPRTDRAFERLYHHHVSDVYRYALAMLRNPADAEDVTQTTFMNAYRAFQSGESPRTPKAWLIAIAHNVCRQRFRQSQRRPAEVELDDNAAAVVPEDDEGPSIADVQRALGYLPFNQRSALVMRELEGRSYAEIAEALELTVSAVETLIFRARRSLREQLEGALTCHEAELAISRQLDRRLPREERGRLRAHLRECRECALTARRLRAQRVALKGLGAIPLPASLSSFFGGGAAAGGAGATIFGSGLTAKVAALAAGATLAAGAGYEGTQHLPPLHRAPAKPKPAAVVSAAAPVAPAHGVAHVAPDRAASGARTDVRPQHAIANTHGVATGRKKAQHAGPGRHLGLGRNKDVLEQPDAVTAATAVVPAQPASQAAAKRAEHARERAEKAEQHVRAAHGKGSARRRAAADPAAAAPQPSGRARDKAADPPGQTKQRAADPVSPDPPAAAPSEPPGQAKQDEPKDKEGPKDKPPGPPAVSLPEPIQQVVDAATGKNDEQKPGGPPVQLPLPK